VVVPIINRSSVRNFLHVTLLAARIWRWLVVFLGNFFAPDEYKQTRNCDNLAQVTGIISLQN